ncbi:DNA/RNA non-specific endonuclease [Fructobacillus ficulneus]|uniref:Streptococcal phage DNAse n=1 Tax=Fructobacillus ficulneus TaxID=157463 RepID=A0A0K8MFD3_9LACO|nr:DNA/RNA non-specific endonuclease [Fructobacillus ficulneus]GAO99220.1 streptococcal phage DNAse [Fructobacillus ficulneus]
MSDIFVLLFLVAFVWLIIEWRRGRKNGLKLQKKGKWLLVAVIIFAVAMVETEPANTNQTKADDQSAKKASSQSKKTKKTAASSSSSAESQKTTASSINQANGESQNSEILTFTGKRQLVLGNLDSLGRATFSHIQLQDKDEPKAKRTTLTYNPVGWHNFKFYYGAGAKKAWLMNRGHLVGYQFSGINDEARNLVPETAWFNAGNYTGMNDGNPDSMLYYENRLDSWLSNHPNYWLDYQVTPLFTGDELVPRQVELAYVGLDANGQPLTIQLGSAKESTDAAGVTHVTLDNSSPNAQIDYATGRATNTIDKNANTFSSDKSTTTKKGQSKQGAQSSSTAAVVAAPTASSRTVYVSGNGSSDIYWYNPDDMPARTNKSKVITMTEADAQAQGKRHASKE